MSLAIKIIALIVLWVGSIWGYFHWKFKHEKSVLPPEVGYDPEQ